MKALFLTLVSFLTISTAVQAQRKVEDYQSLYFKKSFDIKASQDTRKPDRFTYYIEVEPAEERKTNMMLESQRVPTFVEFLNSAKNTYTKWAQTAKDNNVTELEKSIDLKPYNCEAGFVYGDWNFDFNVFLEPRVKILDGKMVLIISSDELQSSSNQFMKHKGFYYVFTSPAEVDEFIAKLDVEKVKAQFSQKNKTEDLFKN